MCVCVCVCVCVNNAPARMCVYDVCAHVRVQCVCVQAGDSAVAHGEETGPEREVFLQPQHQDRGQTLDLWKQATEMTCFCHWGGGPSRGALNYIGTDVTDMFVI